MTRSTINLTRAYAASPYRASATSTPRYVRCSGAVACDECIGRRLENAGSPVPVLAARRAVARVKRIMPFDGPSLFLCGADEQRWRERDDADRAAA